MKILIVDDDKDIRDSLDGLLNSQGFEVTTASNGAEALDLLRGSPLPCAVILDLAMPVLDGAETFAQMQADPGLAQVPVFIFTSDDRLLPSGARSFRKPADIDRLLRAVRNVCSPPSSGSPAGPP